MNSDLILILDFGGKEAYYTARRLRGERFYCEILPGNTPIDELIALAPKGMILAGGDSRALRCEALPFDPALFETPVLAFGGTARMLAEQIGAEHRGILLENNKDFVQFSACTLFDGLDENDRFFERVDGYALPEGYAAIASTPSGLVPAFPVLKSTSMRYNSMLNPMIPTDLKYWKILQKASVVVHEHGQLKISRLC